MDMQPRSLPTRRYTSRCYVTNSYIGKSVHLLLGEAIYLKPSPYRAVNTPRLGYENQSVNAVLGNNRCLFSDPHKPQIHGV